MKNYTHLNTAERELIFLKLGQGNSLREIGRILGRHHTTVQREIERNGEPAPTEKAVHYLPHRAQEQAHQRRRKSKIGKLEDPGLRSFVIKKLGHGWSPEQIAGRLKLKAPNCIVSHETIYKFIYSKENQPLRFWEFLRRGRKRRQALYGRRSQSVKRLAIPDKTLIDERPVEVGGRARIGDFESDLMEGIKAGSGFVSTTVERKSGFVFLDKLITKEADQRAEVLIKTLKKLPTVNYSLTLDNGLENYQHQKVSQSLGMPIYFCNPYHSWEKGTVENTIGLVRNYLPKKADLNPVTQAELNVIAGELNHRPRKRHGFYTPAEVVFNETGWCI